MLGEGKKDREKPQRTYMQEKFLPRFKMKGGNQREIKEGRKWQSKRGREKIVSKTY